MFNTLRSKRLEVREFYLEDTEEIYTLSQEAGIREWIPDQVYEDRDEAREVLDFLISQYIEPLDTTERPLVLAIILSENSEVIGHIGLSPHLKNQTEIGYAIADKHSGKGYATEAVSLISEWATSVLGLDGIYGVVASENIGSYKVLEKANFKITEELKMDYLGKMRECKVYNFQN